MKAIEFKKTLGQLLAADKTAAAGIVNLARVAIDHYHNNSFDRSLVDLMINGLQRRPQLLNKFKSIASDCTVKKGVKKEDKKAAKVQARRGYAWLKQQELNSLIEYVRYEKRAGTGINKPAPAATFKAKAGDKAQAVIDAEKKVNKLKADLESASQSLAAACDAANIPAPSSEKEVIQDPALLAKVEQLETENSRLTQQVEHMPAVKEQLKTAKLDAKQWQETALATAQKLKERDELIAKITELANTNRTKFAKEIMKMVANAK